MKNLGVLFSIIFMFLSSNLAAQKFVNSANTWLTIDRCLLGNTGSTYFLSFGEDTLVDGLVYKELLAEDNANSFVHTVGHLFREENNQVYFRSNDTETEVLMYDFNLALGDTIVNMFHGQLKVVSVDMISLKSGEQRRRLHLSKPPATVPQFTWIEGVGSPTGTHDPFWWAAIDCESKLGCFSTDNVELFCPDQISSSENEPALKRQLSIYPNPAAHLITIDLEDTLNLEAIEIYSFDGKKRMTSKSFSIDITELIEGPYVVCVILNSGERLSRKFVKI